MAVKLRGQIKKALTAVRFDESAVPHLVLTLTVEINGIDGKTAGELAQMQGDGEVRLTVEEVQTRLPRT